MSVTNQPSDKVYRAGIIGLTGIGQSPPRYDLWSTRHPQPHSHASAYAAHPRAQVVAVCELVPELLTQYDKNWGPAAHYSDYRAMLERENLDILSVVTSDHLHAQMVVDAAEAGVPAIFCEKPLATTLADADRMLAAVEQNGTVICVDHGRRWDPFWRQALSIIEEGRIGSLTRISAHLGGERAMLFRNGTHLVDTVCMYADAAPDWLIGAMEEGYEDRTEYLGDGGHDPATDPGASAYLHFTNGVRAHIEVSQRTLVNFELDLLCTNGRIRISNTEALVYLTSAERPYEVTSRQLGGSVDYRSAMVNAVDELIHLIENGGESISSGRRALHSLEIMIAIMRSQASGVEKIYWPLARD
ncbi:MAG: Gfo/Idh/MocA family oxidoreductase [Caldilineaceae bacterium SB0661_bin_32]|uniref:Gfo/Idh/MocA family oxidoreductase n=1 Tax=Caldilineaceae bacterium SB0661_bin_32 TaxID=2605255 RepID=A0A6B1D5P1_9CHLR|nr:Gfo/Idh/MocA family oxidoreductase [Caldilineaceae bacterium SB0661_bin_32]